MLLRFLEQSKQWARLLWVHGGAYFAAVGTAETVVARAAFVGWPIVAEGGDDDGHREVVAEPAEQVRCEHASLRELVMNDVAEAENSQQSRIFHDAGPTRPFQEAFSVTHSSSRVLYGSPYLLWTEREKQAT
jgi:hypothetical protein